MDRIINYALSFINANQDFDDENREIIRYGLE